MAVEIQDVLKASLVMVGVELLNSREEVQRFSTAVGTDVMTGTIMFPGIPNPPPDVPAPGTTLTLNRDRIVIDVSQNRTAIEREYPAVHDLERLAEVAGYAIKKTKNFENQTLRAIGYNIELVYNQTSGKPAVAYLRDRLFNPNVPRNDGWKLAGGNARLTFIDDDGRLWNISLEPRFNEQAVSRIFMSLNAHKEKPEAPNTDDIRHYLQEAWEQAHDFVSRLDAAKWIR